LLWVQVLLLAGCLKVPERPVLVVDDIVTDQTEETIDAISTDAGKDFVSADMVSLDTPLKDLDTVLDDVTVTDVLLDAPGDVGEIVAVPKCGDGEINLLGEECDDANNEDWDGCHECKIVEFLVAKWPAVAGDTSTLSLDGASTADAKVDGGFILVWSGQLANGVSGIWSQRFDPFLSTPYGTLPEPVRLNKETAVDQLSPHVTVLETGGYAVVWTSANNGIRIWRDSVASETTTDEVVSTGTADKNASVARLPGDDIYGNIAGNLVVVWDDGNTIWRRSLLSSSWDILEQENIDVSGDSVVRERPSVALSLDKTALVVVWQETRPSANPQIHFRRHAVDTDGTIKFVDIDVAELPDIGTLVCPTCVYENVNSSQTNPVVKALGEGFVVTWQSEKENEKSRVFVATLGPDGISWSTDEPISGNASGDNSLPDINAISESDYAAVWARHCTTVDCDNEVIARLASDSAELPVNQFAAGEQTNPVILLSRGGDRVLAWTSHVDELSSSPYQIYMQRFDQLGNRRYR